MRQRFPHALLERGRRDVERQVERVPRAVEVRADLRDERREPRGRFDQFGARECVLEFADERRRIVAERDPADALFSGGDEHRAE